MKTAIIYASKTNTAKNCAEMLAEELKGKTKTALFALPATIPLGSYASYVIGAPVRAGRISGKMKRFLNANKAILLQKPLYIYLCCVSVDDFDKYIKDNIPAELADKAVACMRFGAEFNKDTAKGLQKMMLNAMTKSYKKENRPLPEIDRIKIKEMSSMICG